MSQVASPPEIELALLPETAVAMRIIRSEHVQRRLLRWLAAPAHPRNSLQLPDASQADDLDLAPLIHELIAPLVESATGRERKQAQHAAEYFSLICREIARAASAHETEIGAQLLAASILPLYRCLATGEFGRCFEQSRQRLLEGMAILALCTEFGSELVEIFDNALSEHLSPHVLLEELLGFNVVSASLLIREYVDGFRDTHGDFDEDAYVGFGQVETDHLSTQLQQIPDWADPDLLWRLAGQINTDAPNIVVPRSWIEVDVPWQSTLEHWQRLLSALTKTRPSPQRVPTPLSNQHSRTNDSDPIRSSNTEMSPMNSLGSTQLGKVLIAEILSHNDPAFVNLIQRQLTRCRAEARPISLAAVVVHQANQRSDDSSRSKSTIQPWQQQIVNRIADHPYIEDSFAFVTTDSELFVCILDMERSDATQLLRGGLTRILGIDSESEGKTGLTAAKSPAFYYAGLASAGNANPKLSPEDLVEATLRCLTAAGGSQKSSIKSIEVY